MFGKPIGYSIDLDKLLEIIAGDENKMESEMKRFWNLIKIVPEKWNENEYHQEDGWFWVIGIFGKKVIYYDDIEEGFNISEYPKYGKLKVDAAEQDELQWTIHKIMNSTLLARISSD